HLRAATFPYTTLFRSEWQPTFTSDDSRPAVLAFNGDVYEGLDASSLSAASLAWLQDHLVILSGLYGALRPLDMMRPYRLEMGTRSEEHTSELQSRENL